MEKRYTIGVMIGNANSPHTMNLIDYKGKKVSRKSIIELAKLAGFEITEA